MPIKQGGEVVGKRHFGVGSFFRALRLKDIVVYIVFTLPGLATIMDLICAMF
jgi:hypothetical protein